MITHSDSVATTIQTSSLYASKVTPNIPSEVDHRGHTSGRSKGNEGTLHFAMVKKVNTFYLRILHYTGNPNRQSVTVSLRTGKRYQAMGNADYLKQRLIDRIGNYNDFEDIRYASKTIARSELKREQINWFATDNHQIMRETHTTQSDDIPIGLPSQHQQFVPKAAIEPTERDLKVTITSLIELFIEDKIASRAWKPSTEYCRKA